MRQVPNDAWAAQTHIGQMFVPAVVDIVCPHCVKTTSVVTNLGEANINAAPSRGHCTRCKQELLFFDVALTQQEQGARRRTIFVHPDPPFRDRANVEDLSEGLQRTYRSAIDSLEAGHWDQAGVMAGKALEGLLINLLEDAGDTVPKPPVIARLVQAVVQSKTIDLGKPITSMADALRQGRNLSAHFNAERALDREAAEELVDLLDSMIEYLKVLPRRVEQLVEALTRSPGSEVGDDELDALGTQDAEADE